VEVITSIFYRRNHQGIQNVNSVLWRDRFTNENADGITEGFKTSAPYGDVTDSPMQMPTDSHRTVTCLICQQSSRRNHRSVGIYQWNYELNVENLKKEGGSLARRLLRVFFTDGITEGFKTSAPYSDVTDSPMKMLTKSPKDSKHQLRTVMWPIQRSKCRRIRTVRWCALFADRVADGITDGIAIGEAVGKS
jgi:hypothetical protein